MDKHILIVFFLLTLSYSCLNQNKNISQTKINHLTSEVLRFTIENKCFNYSSFAYDSIQNVISVSNNFILNISESDSIVNLDLKNFLKNSDSTFIKSDTFKINNWGNKQVIMSDFNEINSGWDFQYILAKKINGTSKIKDIRSFIFSKPYMVNVKDGHEILFKVMRFFENPVEFQYVLVLTDKFFNIKKIECLENGKQIFMPMPPWEYYDNQEQIYPDTTYYDW